MAVFPLQVGDDLNKRTLTLSIPSGTTFSSRKFIAATSSGYYITEGLLGTVSVVGITRSTSWRQESDFTMFFYSTASANETSVNLPDGIGVVTWINPLAVCYPYIKRTANEKMFVYSEDLQRFEIDRVFADRIISERATNVTTDSGINVRWVYSIYKSGAVLMRGTIIYPSDSPLSTIETTDGIYVGLDKLPFPENLFTEDGPITFLEIRNASAHWVSQVRISSGTQLSFAVINIIPNSDSDFIGAVYVYAMGMLIQS